VNIIKATTVIVATILTLGFSSTGWAGVNCPPGTIYIGGHHCRLPGRTADRTVNPKGPVIDLPSGGKKGGQGQTSRQ
jgi:hypothetical protein